ncbi:DNA internalization-related competence protein ComEC/Rec2 [Chromatiaceae bacterium AAb-1]|nr:DNA internalization-related competence protein ComEC/Rec2 [Chromatiaceae bacterium AAb-1]
MPVVLFCCGVVAGSLLSLFLPVVPALFLLFFIIPVLGLLCLLRQYFIAGILGYLLCFIWHYHQHNLAATALLQHKDEVVSGVIEGIPVHHAEYSQFILRLEQGQAAGYRVRLNWMAPEVLPVAGQKWQLQVRLKPAGGVANPGGVNRETAALVDGIVAQGAVRDSTYTQLLADNKTARQWLAECILSRTESLETGVVQAALSVGVRQFDTALWQGLQHSALGHIMAISGLHVGLVFGWVFWISSALLKYGRLPLLWHRNGALLLALIAACGYAWASGFAIPAIRAIAGLAIAVVARLLLRQISLSTFWFVLAAALLLTDPFLVLSKSFWLSMLAVAFIFLLVWRYPSDMHSHRQQIRAFFRFHFWLTILMSLLGLLLFGGTTTLGLISNLIFVPWCSIVAIPVLLITMLYELLALPGSIWLWQLTDWLFLPLWYWLQWCAAWQVWLVFPAVTMTALVVTGCCAAILLVYRQRLVVLFTAVCFLPAVAVANTAPDWRLHIVDVGQGLAVVLQYQQRALVYDVGPRYGDYSATEVHLLPFLRYQGITTLDYLVLSHDDADHTGNWRLLPQYYPDLQLVTDIPVTMETLACQQIPADYLGVKVIPLMPEQPPARTKNDSSCVLLLQVDGWRVLLPGDISQQQELLLLQAFPDLQAHLLVLAHHGSNSSSALPFLQQLQPQLALNSAGRFNSYNHPARAVKQRLALFGIPLLNTAENGAITIIFSAESLQVLPYRRYRMPLWLQKPAGIAET